MSEQEPRAPHTGPVPPWWTDPTENVISLVDAAMKRQDDLREMQARYVAQIGQMREGHATYVAEMRSDYERQLREAESGRIDAIRAVDVGAVNRAAEVQATQANTLAAQVVTTADAFRVSLASALAPIQASIEDLRRAQYEAQGQKTQVVESRDVHGERRLDIAQVIAVVAVIVAVLSATLYALKK